MKTKTIVAAIIALRDAEKTLMAGDQVRGFAVASDCLSARRDLMRELVAERPETKIDPEENKNGTE